MVCYKDDTTRQLGTTTRLAFLFYTPYNQIEKLMSFKPDWAAISVAYYNGMAIGELCKKFGITSRVFYLHSEKNGWLLQDGTSTPKRLRNRKTMMLIRVGTIIEAKITSLEQRMCDGANKTSLDDARDANTLRTLITLLEKLTLLEGQGREASTPTTGAEDDQAERLRTGLAKRLEDIQEYTD